MESETMKRQVRDAKKRMRGKRSRIRRRRRVFCILSAVFGAAFGFVTFPAVAQQVISRDSITGQMKYYEEASQNVTEKETEKKQKNKHYPEASGLLVIANKNNELPKDYDPGLRPICNGRLQAAAVIYDDLAAMLTDAGRAGYDYWIASAYRSRERQQELIDEDVREFMKMGMGYEEALEKTLEETQPAGHSEHETGLSLDILCAGNTDMDISQSYEPGNRWLVQHCAEYGFILRYPADKEDITGVAYEPWHFRYVGKKAAKQIMKQGITLEEYLGEEGV